MDNEQPETKGYKAYWAFFLAFLGALVASLKGDVTNFGDLTPLQWFIVVATAIVTGGTVFQVTNPLKREEPR